MRAGPKLPFLLALAFVAGALTSHYSFKLAKPTQHDRSELRQELDILRARLQDEETRKKHLESEPARIATVDFADYRRLQNEEEQFIKAKEILGKVFLVLFHNVLSSIGRKRFKERSSCRSLSSKDRASSSATPMMSSQTAKSNTSVASNSAAELSKLWTSRC